MIDEPTIIRRPADCHSQRDPSGGDFVAIFFQGCFLEHTHRLNIKGLMVIGLFSGDWRKVRAGFRQLRELRDMIAQKNINRV